MASPNDPNTRLVFSSQQGRICPACNRPVADCICRQQKVAPKGDGIVRVGRETKGRKGAGLSLVSGVPLAGEELKTLAQELKKRCGCGGTVRDGIIEIQGDHRQLLVEELKKRGWTVKLAGG